MSWSVDLIPDQKGRVAFVTGANSGLGFETSKVLIKKGATVILGCRSVEKATIAREELLKITNSVEIDVLGIDLSDLSIINEAAEKIKKKFKRLDLLINNAGVMAPPLTLSQQGLEIQFAVNHLSHMALTLKLLPLIANKKGGRVITVSSGAQFLGGINWGDLQGEQKYSRWASYSQSKLANIMFALELHNRLKNSAVDIASISAHPGIAKTNLQSKSLGSWQEAIAWKVIGPICQSAEMGALPQLFAATEPKAKSGKQYGPRFNFRGDPVLCNVAPKALDKSGRERLWEISQSLIENQVDISEGNNLLTKDK